MKYYKIDSVIGTQKELPINAIEISRDEYNRLLIEAKERSDKLDCYTEKIINDEITINEVPIDFRKEVEVQILLYPNNSYGVDNETYNNIIDDYTLQLTEEVANNGY